MRAGEGEGLARQRVCWVKDGGPAAVIHLSMRHRAMVVEGSFEVWLLNAQRVRAIPGRKTDVRDAEWIAELLRHGLVQPSFIPPREQRELRELTRQRTNFVRGRATLINRVQKVLESTNLKITSVVSNIAGTSGRAILAALLGGEEDVAVLAELAKGKLRKKRTQLQQALSGRL